jgi:hypothetical protein
MTDPVHERLADAGRRWQAAQAPAPGVPVHRLVEEDPRRTPPRRALLATAAAVAAVAVIGTSAFIGTRSGDGGSAPAPSGPGPESRTVGQERDRAVPWAALPAAHPQLRTRPKGNRAKPWTTPYDGISVTGRINGRVHPGDTLVFTASLESSTNVPLDPCPDINIAIGSHNFQTWQLNCAAVPYVDSRGRHYLPAFKAVPFTIQVVVPDEPGRQKVLFTIDGPHRMPGFYGLIGVAPAG